MADADKVGQLQWIAQDIGIGPERVIRIDDRYDREEEASLKKAGFPHFIVMEGGYVFPWDLDEARDPDSGVTVLPRKGFAHVFGEKIREWGL